MTTVDVNFSGDTASPANVRLRQVVGIVMFVTAILFATTFAANLFAASHTRFVADDLLLAVGLRKYGVIGALIWGCSHWTGRYMAGVIGDVACAISPDGHAGWFPACILLAWVVLCYATARTRLGVGFSLLLALGIPAVTLLIAPNPFESVYWVTGVSCYLTTLVGLTAVAYLMLRRPSVFGAIACCILPIALAGLCEPAALITPAFVLCGLAIGLFRVRLCIPVMVSCLIGVALVALAPGNHVRIQAVAVHPTMIAAGLSGIVDMQLFLNNAATLAHPPAQADVLHWSGSGWALIGLGIVVALATALWTSIAITPKALLAALACGQFAMWVPFFLCRYGIARPAPDRSMIVADFALVVVTAIVGLYAGQYVRKWSTKPVFALASFLIVTQLVSIPSLAANFARPAVMAAFSRNWDREDARIRHGGPIGRPLANPGDNGTEATDWQLAAARAYYGQDKVVADSTLLH